MQNAEFKMRKLNSRMLVCAFCILQFALLGLLSACSTRVKADTLPPGPPLAVPIAPAHAIAIEQVAEAPPPEEPPAPEPITPTTKPPAPRTAPRTTTQPRAETAPPPATPPAAVAQPQSEAPTVRATPTAGSAAEERKVRDLLFRASESLKKVPYEKLSNEGRAQYDQSKRFSEEANQAVKERNFVYAVTLAEKAATLAAELVR